MLNRRSGFLEVDLACNLVYGSRNVIQKYDTSFSPISHELLPWYEQSLKEPQNWDFIYIFRNPYKIWAWRTNNPKDSIFTFFLSPNFMNKSNANLIDKSFIFYFFLNIRPMLKRETKFPFKSLKVRTRLKTCALDRFVSSKNDKISANKDIFHQINAPHIVNISRELSSIVQQSK